MKATYHSRYSVLFSTIRNPGPLRGHRDRILPLPMETFQMPSPTKYEFHYHHLRQPSFTCKVPVDRLGMHSSIGVRCRARLTQPKQNIAPNTCRWHTQVGVLKMPRILVKTYFTDHDSTLAPRGWGFFFSKNNFSGPGCCTFGGSASPRGRGGNTRLGDGTKSMPSSAN